jgi:hypothetical protein
MGFRSIKHGIKNLYNWFPVIWDDYDWDHSTILTILKFKLDRMEKAFRSKHAMAVDSEKLADQIKRCSLVLDRLIEDDYTAFDKHDEKWGEISMEFEGNKLNIERPNAVTEEDKVKESKEFLDCCEHEDYLINQDLEFLFDTMKKHIRSWWD